MSSTTTTIDGYTPPTMIASCAAGIEYITIDGVRVYPGQTAQFERHDGRWVLVEWIPAASADEDDTDH